MIKKTRLLTLLALLLTAATGAWAEEQSEAFTTATGNQLTYTGTHFTITGQSVDSDGLYITGNNSDTNQPNTVTISAINGETITRIEAVVGYNSTNSFTVVATPGTVSGSYSKEGTITISNINASTVTLSSSESNNKLLQFRTWTVYYTAASSGYTVSMKDGVKDADKWTITPNPAEEGQTVTATYSGTRRVKSVKAVKVEVIPVGAIKGKFTINNTGKQVYFAKGNLQAVCTSADNNPSDPETFTWQFAENQWDCVGNNAANYSIDGNGSVSAAGTVDLFGWSTAATTYGIHNSTTASDYSGDFVDWGGTIGTGWRTLTKDEWNYLFMTRESGSKVNGMSPSPDNARYTHATINTDNGTDGIRGMILFPDGVTVNYSDATSWGGINQYSNWNGSTKCTTSQWNALAAKGFVFLPTGGVRNGTTISNSNNNGYYWSSYTASPTSGYAHYTRVVPANEPTTSYDSRKIGISVRLVYDVE